MKMPSPTWKTNYKADRRKHHHRCYYCNRIIKDDESVIVARVMGKKTKALHSDCAERPFHGDHTYGDLLAHHGMAYLASCGWKDAQSYLDNSPLSKPQPVAT